MNIDGLLEAILVNATIALLDKARTDEEHKVILQRYKKEKKELLESKKGGKHAV